jgi:hypothetical protein
MVAEVHHRADTPHHAVDEKLVGEVARLDAKGERWRHLLISGANVEAVIGKGPARARAQPTRGTSN